ncbi:hypothetical protein C1H46_031753 [Malus baccata]|uniref:Uncharacterized protein n=1 Tax=Malus baccata TaxID=106549 RepID=A0A540L8A8_MALBA|nr:hypothetical protein C1H46_031753 [Malus baccata]
MKERSREMRSSPPTAEEIFRNYSTWRTDVVYSLTNERSSSLKMPLLESSTLFRFSHAKY